VLARGDAGRVGEGDVRKEDEGRKEVEGRKVGRKVGR
jgi:hypothetical protein